MVVDIIIIIIIIIIIVVVHCSSVAQQPLVDQSLLIIGGFTITLRHTTLGRTPLDE
jgi:hypothetical protein